VGAGELGRCRLRAGAQRTKQRLLIRQASAPGRQCFAAKAAQPFTPRYGASLGRRARSRVARDGPAGAACEVAETSRHLGVCACVGKRRASGGTGGPDGEAGAASAGSKIFHSTPIRAQKSPKN
jgi:hypothetical protein